MACRMSVSSTRALELDHSDELELYSEDNVRRTVEQARREERLWRPAGYRR